MACLWPLAGRLGDRLGLGAAILGCVAGAAGLAGLALALWSRTQPSAASVQDRGCAG
jgi:hypothetical protein